MRVIKTEENSITCSIIKLPVKSKNIYFFKTLFCAIPFQLKRYLSPRPKNIQFNLNLGKL